MAPSDCTRSHPGHCYSIVKRSPSRRRCGTSPRRSRGLLVEGAGLEPAVFTSWVAGLRPVAFASWLPFHIKRTAGLEPATFELAIRCATTAPYPRWFDLLSMWSLGPGSNWRPRAYEARALPAELPRQINTRPRETIITEQSNPSLLAGRRGVEPRAVSFGGSPVRRHPAYVLCSMLVLFDVQTPKAGFPSREPGLEGLSSFALLRGEARWSRIDGGLRLGPKLRRP